MMIEPPIDKLIEKAGCKYALVCLVSKRARILLDRKLECLLESGERAITYAAYEVFDDKILVGVEE